MSSRARLQAARNRKGCGGDAEESPPLLSSPRLNYSRRKSQTLVWRGGTGVEATRESEERRRGRVQAAKRIHLVCSLSTLLPLILLDLAAAGVPLLVQDGQLMFPAFPVFLCRMLAKSPASPLVTAEAHALLFCATCNLSSSPGVKFSKRNNGGRLNTVQSFEFGKTRGATRFHTKWQILSADQAQASVVDTGEIEICEECKQMLTSLNFSSEDSNKMLKKAFGWIHSPYWSEERKKEVPNVETVSGVLNYIRSLGLSDDDLHKVLKKFPEVLGCDLNSEVKLNVSKLDSDWGINGKTLRSLLLRNPKVLGYNIDCRGDCMAQCTRCWVRF
ncbi:hypothetical protein EJB05_03456, partial [Eragrostis curvula]